MGGDGGEEATDLRADYVHPDIATVAIDGDEAIEDDDLRCGREAVRLEVYGGGSAREGERRRRGKVLQGTAAAARAGPASAPSVLALVRMVLSASFFSKANSSVALAKLDL